MEKTPKKPGLSIVLPVYNEEATIEFTLETVLAYVEKLTGDFEIIAVNDGSTDQSRKILGELADKNPRVILINSSKNTGYGWALRKGMISARKDWILLFDADGQFDIADLGRLWEAKAGHDLILGWRRKRSDSLYRRCLGSSGNWLANLILRMRFFVKDINCGFKLFKTGSIKPLALISTGGTINFEILYRLKSSHPVCGQVPVSHYPRKTGRATGGDLNSVIIIIRESLKIIFKHAPA